MNDNRLLVQPAGLFMYTTTFRMQFALPVQIHGLIVEFRKSIIEFLKMLVKNVKLIEKLPVFYTICLIQITAIYFSVAKIRLDSFQRILLRNPPITINFNIFRTKAMSWNSRVMRKAPRIKLPKTVKLLHHFSML